MRALLFFPLIAFAQMEIPYFPPPQPPRTFSLYSPATYKACWDLDMSPYAGGEDLLFVHRALERGELYFLKKNSIAYSKSTFARMWRLSELITIWLPINYFASVVQHEIFGHGYRIRDVGPGRAKVSGYSFGIPPPYGDGGGSTSFDSNANLTTTEEVAMASAGAEATAIFALLTKWKWIEAGKIDPRQAALYLFNQHDLNLYIGTLKAIDDEDLSGHDIHGYVQALNYTYPDNILSKGRLRSLSWINLADPFTFYAIYSWFHYLASGKESGIPMIASRYLPGFRLGLTPFGPEMFFEQFILHKKWPIYAYLKGGHHAKNKYYGIGVYIPHLFTWKGWFLGIRADLWRQPKLLLQPGSISIEEINFDQKPSLDNPLYPASQRHAVRYGGAGSFLLGYGEKYGFESEFGYKAQGFLPGYSLRAFPTVRGSLTLVF